MKNTSKETLKEISKKSQLTEIIVPEGGLSVEVRIHDIETPLFDEDEKQIRTSYRAIINKDTSIGSIYNDRGELCSIEALKKLDPQANIFNKDFRKYLIRTYGLNKDPKATHPYRPVRKSGD